MPDPVIVAPAPPAPVVSPATVADGAAITGTAATVDERKSHAPVTPPPAPAVIPAAVAAPASRLAFTFLELCLRLF